MSLGNYYRAGSVPFGATSLTRDVRADVCVIGGGYTGLSAALHLGRSGARTVLVEAQCIGAAASGRNGGQIHTGFRKEQSVLERWLGPVHARQLWDLAEESKKLVHDLVVHHGIACSLKDGLVMAAHNTRAVRTLAEDAEHLARHYSYPSFAMWDATETRRQLGAGYSSARFDAGGGHLNPLAFALGLARAAGISGVTIHERSPVLMLEESPQKVHVHCEHGKIVADKVVVALDSFTGTLLPEVARFIGQVESFMVATAPLSAEMQSRVLPSDAAVADTRHVLDYYRKSDGRLLFAGRESYWNIPQDIAKVVRPRMVRVFPFLKDIALDYAWSGTVGITRTRMPHFGRRGARIAYAHGYSGQGVALANLGGKLLAEQAVGDNERFEVLVQVPPSPFLGGAYLRKPLMAAGLAAYKIADLV